jgi:hypothetical protein
MAKLVYYTFELRCGRLITIFCCTWHVSRMERSGALRSFAPRKKQQKTEQGAGYENFNNLSAVFLYTSVALL